MPKMTLSDSERERILSWREENRIFNSGIAAAIEEITAFRDTYQSGTDASHQLTKLIQKIELRKKV